jgi:hypothetical protein
MAQHAFLPFLPRCAAFCSPCMESLTPPIITATISVSGTARRRAFSLQALVTVIQCIMNRARPCAPCVAHRWLQCSAPETPSMHDATGMNTWAHNGSPSVQAVMISGCGTPHAVYVAICL